MISVIAVIMAVLMLLSLVASVIPSAFAISQSDIDALQAKKDEISARVKEAEARVDTLKDAQANVLDQKAALEEKNDAAKEALRLVGEEIVMYDGRRDLGGVEDAYIEAREESERVKAEYEDVKADCEAKQEVLNAEKEMLDAQIAETEEELAELEDQIDEAVTEYEGFLAAEEAAAQEIAAMMAAYQRQKEEEAAARAAAIAQQAAQNGGGGGGDGGLNPGGAVGTGNLGWPVPCSTRITSRFGNRSDPFTGETRYHSGIDIDGYGNDGAPVVASDGGSVVTATYNDGYGNYVIIDHGNGYQTLYAHMSGLAVGAGQTVSQGQTVGYLGATGRATGTHCHFEVFINGCNATNAEVFHQHLRHIRR